MAHRRVLGQGGDALGAAPHPGSGTDDAVKPEWAFLGVGETVLCSPGWFPVCCFASDNLDFLILMLLLPES